MTSRPARSTPASPRAVSLLPRIILPRPGEPLDVRKLYIEESDTNARRAHAPHPHHAADRRRVRGVLRDLLQRLPGQLLAPLVDAESVVLRVELTGSARVDVYRSKATGARISVGGTEVASAERRRTRGVVEFEVELDAVRGRRLDLVRHHHRHQGRRCTAPAGTRRVPAPGRANITVGIPTFNRPADCVNALRGADVGSVGGRGDRRGDRLRPGHQEGRDHPGFAAAAAALGDRLSIHDQPNLGGSGGYSRVMYEALKNTDCEQILFMDDDIRIEPDSILRALAFNRFAKTPDADRRSDAQPAGAVAPARDGRGGRPGELHVDQRRRTPSTTTTSPSTRWHDDEEDRSKLLHRRIDVDYNGWWMCMIPRRVAEELGQPLPLFIKWDDADYGLRAGEHGYPTVTMPGTAIWHMAWSDKDDAIDWQAYFHLRNRLVVAALHWDGTDRRPDRELI